MCTWKYFDNYFRSHRFCFPHLPTYTLYRKSRKHTSTGFQYGDILHSYLFIWNSSSLSCSISLLRWWAVSCDAPADVHKLQLQLRWVTRTVTATHMRPATRKWYRRTHGPTRSRGRSTSDHPPPGPRCCRRTCPVNGSGPPRTVPCCTTSAL